MIGHPPIIHPRLLVLGTGGWGAPVAPVRPFVGRTVSAQVAKAAGLRVSGARAAETRSRKTVCVAWTCCTSERRSE